MISRWRTRGRSVYLSEENAGADVQQATTLALSTADERGRLAALVTLRGVGVPTASVLLHLAPGDACPILDLRALWSLGADEPPATYPFEYWWEYVDACRLLRAQANVTMRRFDRGLWQYSKEHQPARPAQIDAEGEAKSRVAPLVSAKAARFMDRDLSVDAYTPWLPQPWRDG